MPRKACPSGGAGPPDRAPFAFWVDHRITCFQTGYRECWENMPADYFATFRTCSGLLALIRSGVAVKRGQSLNWQSLKIRG